MDAATAADLEESLLDKCFFSFFLGLGATRNVISFMNFSFS